MTVTNNYSLTLPTVGGDTNAWGALLNNGVTTVLDSILGGNLAVSMSSSNVNLTASQFQNLIYTITGTLTTNLNLTIPLSPNSGAVACAGAFIVNNQTTGAYTITVLTVAAGSTGVAVPQGYRSFLYSDGTNVQFNDDQVRSSILSNAGNPNGSVSGTAGSVNTPSSLRFDRTNAVLYVCTATGTTWGAIAAGGLTPQGYLTLSSSTSNVITTSNTAAATTVYYSPLVGALMPISNGTYFTLIPYSQMSLTLTASQAASNIYDVFAFLDSGTLRIGTGPSWLAGGGSITAGSCSRGTGAGSTQLQRLNGLLVNTNAMTAINGSSSYSVGALQGTYLGSIFMDGSAGQVTCNVGYGQSRKWGVWNYYNRRPITLQMGDSTANWSYTSATVRQSNGAAGNTLSVFSGYAEESAGLSFVQKIRIDASGSFPTGEGLGGIGVNSTTVFSGEVGETSLSLAVLSAAGGTVKAAHTVTPFLGINSINTLESSPASGSNITYYGTNAYMLLTAGWNG